MTTENDKAVLNAMFNPNTPFVVEEEKPIDINQNKQVITPEIEEAKKVEVEGVKAAEAGDFQRSVSLFTQAIEIAPEWASAYNNRAQTLRLLNDIEGALNDLNTAIRLAKQHQNYKVLSLALTQRGAIYRLQDKIEDAVEDFKGAAALGNPFAKQQAISLNPYAALCNNALAEMLKKYKCV